VIAAHAMLLLMAAGLAVAVIGTPVHDLQPSAARLLVTAVVAVLAPLFWPGAKSTAGGTIVRVLAWSAIAAALAALLLVLPGSAPQPPLRIAAACAMLLVLLLPLHAAAAVLESAAQRRFGDPALARPLAGTAVALLVLLWGSLPLWGGPAAVLLPAPDDALVDAVVGTSPLTHLAVASGNDLLRNEWFYLHSNLSGRPVNYPGPTPIAASFALMALISLALAFVALRRVAGADPHSPKEPSR
jgi:hypothetical protein